MQQLVNCFCKQKFINDENQIIAHMSTCPNFLKESKVINLTREICLANMQNSSRLQTLVFELKAAQSFVNYHINQSQKQQIPLVQPPVQQPIYPLNNQKPNPQFNQNFLPSMQMNQNYPPTVQIGQNQLPTLQINQNYPQNVQVNQNYPQNLQMNQNYPQNVQVNQDYLQNIQPNYSQPVQKNLIISQPAQQNQKNYYQQEFYSPNKLEEDLKFAHMIAEEEKQQAQLHKDSSMIKCENCKQGFSDMAGLLFTENCCHLICKNCMIKHLQLNLFKDQKPTCPSCKTDVYEGEVKALIGQEFYDKLNSQLLIQMSQGNITECPKCKIQFQFEPGRVDFNTKNNEGKQISEEAAQHYAQFRVRCSCGEDFCIQCKKSPYHIGYTCEKFEKFAQSNKCIYCQEIIIKGDVCLNGECQNKLNQSCRKQLPCGHKCFGFQGENPCLCCLNETCAGNNPALLGTTENDYCSICYTDGLGAAPALQLQCGHTFHVQCVVKKLELRFPGPKISFAYLKCPQCNQIMCAPQHPLVTALQQKGAKMLQVITEKSVKRLEYEGMLNEPRLNDPNDKEYYKQPEKYALQIFAYYECFQCKEPYFAGKRGCDNMRDMDGKLDPSQFICQNCSAELPNSCVVKCEKHGTDFIDYKCKFCCNIASWFCWGNTHFCEDCHKKQNAGDYLTRKKVSELPKCKGPGSCPLKIAHKPNGEEQALGCSVCKNEQANVKDF